ncbi:MAG: hypothetical protein WEE89_21940 [Gemmatimonadota bacterium]
MSATLASVVIAFASGIAMLPFLRGPCEGSFERITIALYIQWYIVTGPAVDGHRPRERCVDHTNRQVNHANHVIAY